MTPRLRTALILLAAALLLFVVIFTVDLGSLIKAVAHTVSDAHEEHPLETAVVAATCLALWIVAFQFTTIAELAIGFIFGMRTGYCVDLSAKYIGSTLSYLLGCTALRSCIQGCINAQDGSDGVLATFAEEAARRPWLTAALMRAAFIPMPLKNYGAAVLGIPPAPFFALLVGFEPIDTYLLVAVGASAKDLASLLRGELPSGSEDAHEAWLHLALIGVQVTAAAGLLVAIGHVAMRLIRERRARMWHAGDAASDARSRGYEPPPSVPML